MGGENMGSMEKNGINTEVTSVERTNGFGFFWWAGQNPPHHPCSEAWLWGGRGPGGSLVRLQLV